jgi:hypothetical protein
MASARLALALAAQVTRNEDRPPPIGWKLVRLIQRVSRENPLWGAPRIADELAVLGHRIGEATVAKSMAKH